MKKGGKEKKGVLVGRFFSVSKSLIFLFPVLLSLLVVSCEEPLAGKSIASGFSTLGSDSTLIGKWTFDGNVKDQDGLSNPNDDGAIVGGGSYVTNSNRAAKLSQAYEFPIDLAQRAYVQINNQELNLKTRNEFTISGWFMPYFPSFDLKQGHLFWIGDPTTGDSGNDDKQQMYLTVEPSGLEFYARGFSDRLQEYRKYVDDVPANPGIPLITYSAGGEERLAVDIGGVRYQFYSSNGDGTLFLNRLSGEGIPLDASMLMVDDDGGVQIGEDYIHDYHNLYLTSDGYLIDGYYGGTADPYLDTYSGPVDIHLDSRPLMENKWYFFAVTVSTVSGGTKVRMYLDGPGSEFDEQFFSDPDMTLSRYYWKENLHLGGQSTTKHAFKGQIAEVEVHSSILDARTLETKSYLCGNDVLRGNEECEDYGIADGDYCSSSCQFEEDFRCDRSDPFIQACSWIDPIAGQSPLTYTATSWIYNELGRPSVQQWAEPGFTSLSPSYTNTVSAYGTRWNGFTLYDSSSRELSSIEQNIVISDCGDGTTQGLEECDDGAFTDSYYEKDAANDDGSCVMDDDHYVNYKEMSCRYNRCGDGYRKGSITTGGITAAGEQCDDGNLQDGDGCDSLCRKEICGDSILNPANEECDDGSTADGDGCSASCKFEDGVVCSDSGLVCMYIAPDKGYTPLNVHFKAFVTQNIGPLNYRWYYESVGADASFGTGEELDYTYSAVGDHFPTLHVMEGISYLDEVSGQVAVWGGCGDGIITSSEVCDDDNTDPNDGCSASCTVENYWTCSGQPSVCNGICHDGQTRGTEVCDNNWQTCPEGVQDCNTACTGWNTCRQSLACSNGVVDSGEACDDGNVVNFDGCSLNCLIEDPDRDGIVEVDDDISISSVCANGQTAGCLDNCPNLFNPDQMDLDNDRFGDACDDFSWWSERWTFDTVSVNPSDDNNLFIASQNDVNNRLTYYTDQMPLVYTVTSGGSTGGRYYDQELEMYPVDPYAPPVNSLLGVMGSAVYTLSEYTRERINALKEEWDLRSGNLPPAAMSGTSPEPDGTNRNVVFGQGLTFDGVNDLSRTERRIFPEHMNDITLSAWVKPSSVLRPGDASLHQFIAGSADWYWAWGANLHLRLSDGTPYFWLGDYDLNGDGTLTTSGPAVETYKNGNVHASIDLRDDKWHHIVGTYQKSTNDMDMYIDGKLVSATPTGSQIAGTITPKILPGIRFRGDRFSVGMRSTGSRHDNHPYKGFVDEVKVYGKAWSATDILAEFSAGKEVLCGNYEVESWEQCDMGPVEDVCTPDYGSDCRRCTSSCTWETMNGPYCGDRITDGRCRTDTGTDLPVSYIGCVADGGSSWTGEEECDDANADESDGCLRSCQADADYDGVKDSDDTCPGYDDSSDHDFDEIPDGCDLCDRDSDNSDDDGDGFAGMCDNCPSDVNPTQFDYDSDGIGNACDTDNDNDGVVDRNDQCYNADDALGCAAPVAFWNFDERTGTLASDSSATFHADIKGASWINKNCDSCLLFEGQRNYLTIRDLEYGYEGLNELSVCAWFRTDYDYPIASYSENWAFLDFDRSEFFSFFIAGGDDGRLGYDQGKVAFATASSSGIDDMQGRSIVNNGIWHFACGVYDSIDGVTGVKKIYVDGVEEARKSVPVIGNDILRYGFIGDGSKAEWFDGPRANEHYNGYLDEIRLYHRALADEEIAVFYAAERVKFDTDEDRINDAVDNCISYANLDQVDSDEDGRGNHCDPDDDDDGILDDHTGELLWGDDPCTSGEIIGCDDNCQNVPNPDQADADGDGVGDICDGGFLIATNQVVTTRYNTPVQFQFQSEAGDGMDTIGYALTYSPTISDQGLFAAVDMAAGIMTFTPNDGYVGTFNFDFEVYSDTAVDQGTVTMVVTSCGNGVTEADAGEGCDDENSENLDGCLSSCLADGDRDSVADGDDNCVNAANAGQADTDGDGIGDSCDNCPLMSNGDRSFITTCNPNGDGVLDEYIGEPALCNQADFDNDNVGDACDCGDGLNTFAEGCDDGNTVDGDGCSTSCQVEDNDGDGDSIADAEDNCPFIENGDQADTDGDGVGDVCEVVEVDSDGDGVPDDVDQCNGSGVINQVYISERIPILMGCPYGDFNHNGCLEQGEINAMLGSRNPFCSVPGPISSLAGDIDGDGCLSQSEINLILANRNPFCVPLGG